MRTYLFSNFQKTLVVEMETDAIVNLPNKATIHDINVIKGREYFDGFVSSGFSFRIPDVVDSMEVKAFVEAKGLSFSIIDPDANTETILNTANAFAIVGLDEDVDADVDDAPYQFTGAVGTFFYEPIGIETENGIGNNTFSVVEGDSLPDGLEMTPEGVIFGTLEDDGEFTVSIAVTDSTGQVLTTEIDFTISPEADSDSDTDS